MPVPRPELRWCHPFIKEKGGGLTLPASLYFDVTGACPLANTTPAHRAPFGTAIAAH